MISLEPRKVEAAVISIIEEYCKELKLGVTVDINFKPGNFIKSQVLLTSISEIEEALHIVIPNEYYVFSEKDTGQLTILETALKIIKVAKNEK